MSVKHIAILVWRQKIQARIPDPIRRQVVFRFFVFARMTIFGYSSAGAIIRNGVAAFSPFGLKARDFTIIY